MSSMVQSFQKRGGISLPVSQPSWKEEGEGLRRRLSSLSLRMDIPTASRAWAFERSKSLSSAGSSIRRWWGWGCSWILSRKPAFAQDLEMNEEETTALGSHNKGSWRHVFYKLKSELRKLMGSQSHNKVGLPQTCRYDSYSYSNNFDDRAKMNILN